MMVMKSALTQKQGSCNTNPFSRRKTVVLMTGNGNTMQDKPLSITLMERSLSRKRRSWHWMPGLHVTSHALLSQFSLIFIVLILMCLSVCLMHLVYETTDQQTIPAHLREDEPLLPSWSHEMKLHSTDQGKNPSFESWVTVCFYSNFNCHNIFRLAFFSFHDWNLMMVMICFRKERPKAKCRVNGDEVDCKEIAVNDLWSCCLPSSLTCILMHEEQLLRKSLRSLTILLFIIFSRRVFCQSCWLRNEVMKARERRFGKQNEEASSLEWKIV